MRPAGEIRQALMAAALAMTASNQTPTQRELAERAGIPYTQTRSTVREMVRGGALQIVRTRRVAYRNRPVAEYAPASGRPSVAAPVFDLHGLWFTRPETTPIQ